MEVKISIWDILIFLSACKLIKCQVGNMNPEHKGGVLERTEKVDAMSLQILLKTVGIHNKLLGVTFPLVIDILINNKSLKTFQEWIYF